MHAEAPPDVAGLEESLGPHVWHGMIGVVGDGVGLGVGDGDGAGGGGKQQPWQLPQTHLDCPSEQQSGQPPLQPALEAGQLDDADRSTRRGVKRKLSLLCDPSSATGPGDVSAFTSSNIGLRPTMKTLDRSRHIISKSTDAAAEVW